MLKAKPFGILLIAIVAILFFKGQAANLFKNDSGGESYYYSRQFDSDMRWVNTDNLSEIGAQVKKDPGGLTYIFPKKGGERVILKVLFGKPYGEINEKYRNLNTIEVGNDGKSAKIFNYGNLRIGDTAIDLSSMLKAKEYFNMHLKHSPSLQDKYSGLAVRRFEVSVLPSVRMSLPNLILILILSLACFIIVRAQKIKRSYIYFFLLVVLLAASVHLRWSEIERLAPAPAHPDVENSGQIGYRQLADKMSLFTEDGFFAAKEDQPHEPFYTLIAKLFLFIFGPSAISLRFASFFFSVLAVFLTYIVGKNIFQDKNIALLATGIISVNRYLIEQSALGLRLELEACFLLILYYFCYLKRYALKDWVWVSISGLIGGLWLLTKSYNIIIILFIFAYSAWNNKNWLPIKKITLFLLASLIAVSLILPYKFNMRKAQKSFFQDSAWYTTSIANNEFSGKPGFPRKKVTLTEYFFKLHTPQQFISYHIYGSVTIFYFLSEQIFNVINEQNHLLKVFIKEKFAGLMKYPMLTAKIAIFSIITLLGVLLCLIKKDTRSIIYVIMIANFPNLFLYGATFIHGVPLISAYRTIAHVSPFMALCEALCIYTIYRASVKKVRSLNLRRG